MPEFPGRLRTPRLAAAPGTPAVGEIYYNTANNTLYWWNGSAWVVAGTPRVVALPGSPVDGQECYYVADATNGVLWHLRYNAGSASAYKWEFLGGAVLLSSIDTQENTTSTTYAALTTAGPQITVALAGDYDVEIGARYFPGANDTVAAMSFAVGATAATDTDALQYYRNTADQQTQTQTSRVRRKTAIAASALIAAQYKVSGGTGVYGARWMRVCPVRVG